jgi:hypothetical protein
MRTLFAIGFVPLGVAALFACAACGGNQGPGGANSAADTHGSTVSPEGGTSSEQVGPATTTVALGDGGDLQGSKLVETHTVASTSASGDPSPKGPHSHDPGRTPADIRAIVVAHRDEARACYDRALPSHPGIEGDLVIQWTIDPKGGVTQISSDTSRSQIAEATVVACVADIIKKIQFAASPGGFETKAFYPFNFHPRHGQPATGAGQ